MLNALQDDIHGLNVPPEQLVRLYKIGAHSSPLSSLTTKDQKNFGRTVERLCRRRRLDDRAILHESKSPMG